MCQIADLVYFKDIKLKRIKNKGLKIIVKTSRKSVVHIH